MIADIWSGFLVFALPELAGAQSRSSVTGSDYFSLSVSSLRGSILYRRASKS